MSKRMFRMTILVPPQMIGTIVELLDNQEGMLVNMVAEDNTPTSPQRKRGHRKSNDHLTPTFMNRPTVRGVMEVFEKNKNSVLSIKQLQKETGFPKGTINSVTHDLLRLSKIARVGMAQYKLI